MILGKKKKKMSKSRGNVINPDGIVKEYGADTLRLYEMFMGPLEKVKPWSMNGVKGVYNFLNKAYRFFADKNNWAETENEEITRELHKSIKKVGNDIEAMKFNTSVSQLMIFTNTCVKHKKVTKKTVETFALLISSLAPHIGEELWEITGHKNTIAYEKFPDYDEAMAKDDTLTIAIQVNGKTRSTLEVAVDISKEDFLNLAKSDEKIKKYLNEGTLVKEIYVQGRICNFVVKPS